MAVKLFRNPKRWAIVKGSRKRSIEIGFHRSRADGSIIGISYTNGFKRQFVTVDTEDVIMAIMHVTHTDEQLREALNNA